MLNEFLVEGGSRRASTSPNKGECHESLFIKDARNFQVQFSDSKMSLDLLYYYLLQICIRKIRCYVGLRM